MVKQRTRFNIPTRLYFNIFIWFNKKTIMTKINPIYPYLAYSELTNRIYIVRWKATYKIDVTDLAMHFVKQMESDIEKKELENQCKCIFPIRPLDNCWICVQCWKKLK